MAESADQVRDVVVVGGGAAGLSAALLLGRARLRVAVVDAGAPRNAPAAEMHGFLSRDGTPPLELLAIGRAEVEGCGVELIEGTVESVLPGFRVLLGDGRELRGRRLLVTTGLRDELPPLPGVAERWGKDVLQCPYCHGYEVRDRALGVLATQPAAVHQAMLVGQWSDDVVFFEHAYPLSEPEREKVAATGARIVSGDVAELVLRDGALSEVLLADETRVPVEALFVAPRYLAQTEVLGELGCEADENGFLAVDGNGATSVPGVWAAGNVVDPRAKVIIAAGAATAAAMALHLDHVEEQNQRAVTAAQAG